MTTLKADRPLVRETSLYHRGKLLTVSLHPGYLTIRQKGTRTKFAVDYGSLWDFGAKIAANAKRLEKLEARKKKGRGR